MSDIYAAVDLGSHTVRALVAEVVEDTGIVHPLEHHRDFTRFALTTGQHGDLLMLDGASLDRVCTVLSAYRDRFRALGTKKILCGATGVFRKVQNGAAILAGIENRFGFSCFVSSEKEEALWSTIGALQVLNSLHKRKGGVDIISSRVLLFDLGGSSTEVVFLDHGKIEWWKSFFIGAASLTRAFIPSAPAEQFWIQEAKKYTGEVFDELHNPLAAFSPDIVIGGGGTVATLGAIRILMDDYVPYQVCGIELDRIWIDGLLQHLASLSLEKRKSVPGLEVGREDVIIGGAIIVSAILALVGRERLIVTDAGFLEGVLIKAVVEEKYGNGAGQVDERSIIDSLTWKIEKR